LTYLVYLTGLSDIINILNDPEISRILEFRGKDQPTLQLFCTSLIIVD